MAGIIGSVCFIILILMVVYSFGDDGQGGNDWIRLINYIAKKTRRH